MLLRPRLLAVCLLATACGTIRPVPPDAGAVARDGSISADAGAPAPDGGLEDATGDAGADGATGRYCCATELRACPSAGTFRLAISMSQGEPVDYCRVGTSSMGRAMGRVTSASTTGSGALRLEIEREAADGGVAKIEITSPSLPEVSVGEWLSMEWTVEIPWLCTVRFLMSKRIDTEDGGSLLEPAFAASDGVARGVAGSGLTVCPVRLGCMRPSDPAERRCSTHVPDVYAMDFSVVDGGETVRIPSAGSGILYATESGRVIEYRVRNLRSWQSTWTDDYWNFAWVVSINRLDAGLP